MFSSDEAHTSGYSAGQGRRMKTGDQFLLGQRPGLEELFHQGVVGLGDHLNQRVARRCRGVGQLGRNRALGRLTASVGGVGPRFHPDEVDDAAEVFLLADWHLDRDDGAAAEVAEGRQ